MELAANCSPLHWSVSSVNSRLAAISPGNENASSGLDRTQFIENKVLEGNLLDLFDQITLFLDRHVTVSLNFEEYERHDVRAIPPFVIREAVVNALVHRDYSQANANVTVALHPDRFEVWNPGSLPEGISPEALPRTHVSRRAKTITIPVTQYECQSVSPIRRHPIRPVS
ncbi:hypothetical protein [Burkholderia pyrrocinia]|uniref:hypothetical protein n=1 Tax=Burkholderia pyrrocinia TaxID=60550 RepID=UPI001EE74F5D|nr:hypothetical protein [Burkholderia pyrrocinia]